MTCEERIKKAVEVAEDYGQIGGDHHRAWVIDQMMRHLLGDGYDEFVKDYCKGDDGPYTYEWYTGIAP